jgi:ABC-type glycerol-3-phosphate transport system substrate-binding protein
VAFGGYANVSNAKDILANLMIQTGNQIVGVNDTGNFVSILADRNNAGTTSASSVLNFYTGFADPLSTQYSWNDSLALSKDNFLSGNLAIYLGYASELADLRNKNPNLNFSVALMPQARDVQVKSTFGNLQALVIMNNSQHKADAFNTMIKLTSADVITFLSTLTNLPPVRLDLLTAKQTDPAADVFYKAALQSKGWLDPDPQSTDTIFSTMVQSITSGQARTDDAVNSASLQLGELLRPYEKQN